MSNVSKIRASETANYRSYKEVSNVKRQIGSNGEIITYKKLSGRERARNVARGGNAFAFLLSIILILLVFGNLSTVADSEIEFGTLRQSNQLTFHTFISTLTDVADVDLLSPVNNAFNKLDETINIDSMNNESSSDIVAFLQKTLNGIINGIRAIVNAVVFAFELVINLVQMVFNLFRVLKIFFAP